MEFNRIVIRLARSNGSHRAAFGAEGIPAWAKEVQYAIVVFTSAGTSGPFPTSGAAASVVPKTNGTSIV